MSFTITTAYTWVDGEVVTAAKMNTAGVPTLANNQTYTFAVGSAATPSINFTGATTTGLYYAASYIGFSVGAASIGTWSATGLSVTGTLGASGLFTSTKTGQFINAASSTTGASYLSIANTTGALNFGVEDSTGATFGATAYDVVVYTGAGRGVSTLIAGTGLVTRISSTGLAVTGAATASTGFGCNGQTAQTAYASGGALAAYGAGANGFDSGSNASALYAMVVSIRAALVANGIMS